MADPVAMYVDVDGIANLTIKNPPVNALAPHVLMGLHDRFLEASARKDVRAIVITGENGKFSGGFDITAIVRQQKAGTLDRNLKDVSVKLMAEIVEGGPKPTVAAIDGLALGGGLELAMSCNARVAVSKAQLGLPELQLGIIPGFGGTQRLPRLVGVQKAIEMMLTSKPVSAEQGLELGLVDKLVATPAELLPAARALALDIANLRAPRMNSLQRTDRLDALGDARAIVTFASAQAKQAAPNVEHPQECLAAVMWGIEHGGYAGLLKEAEIFQRLALSDTSKALAHIFLAQRGTGKVAGVTDKGLKPRTIKTVAVVGGGLMGSGICTALALSGYNVLLKEVNQQFLDGGMGRIEANLMSRVKKGKMSQEKMKKVMGQVRGVLDYAAFSSADMVIEAAIEDIPLKQALFRDLEAACPPHCILATNTSTIDIEVVGKLTKAQPRIIGAHFFSPAHIMPLLEIVRTKQSDAQVLLDTIALGKAIKKVPVVVGNCTGFAVNRVFFPYTSTASLLADLGVDPYMIDRAIKAFGMPMGPFRRAHEEGGVRVRRQAQGGARQGAGGVPGEEPCAGVAAARENGADRQGYCGDDLLPRRERGLPRGRRKGGRQTGRPGHCDGAVHGVPALPGRHHQVGGPGRPGLHPQALARVGEGIWAQAGGPVRTV
eukprot:jgi/Mesvir1/2467/Mv09996-RA.2